MKKRLTNNLSLKLLSVLIAVIAWLIIVNVDNPNMTRTFTGIPIELTGTEVLAENDMTYSTAGTPQATVRVRCPRNLVQRLKASDFKATADITKLYEPTNQVPVTVTCTYAGVLEEQITLITRSIEVSVESINTRQIDVGVQVNGEPAEGYQVGSVVASPSVVTVKAPQSVLDQIGGAGVAVDVSSMSEETTQHAALQFYNAGGNVLDISGLTTLEVSASDITVSVEILNVKNVSIAADVTGQDSVARGSRYIATVIEPQTVKISGRRSQIADLSQIQLPNDELNAEGASETVVKEFQFSDLLLPEGVSLVDSPEEVITVTMQIEKLRTRTISLDLSRITVANLSEELRVVNENATVSVSVEGLTSEIDSLDISEIAGKADLDGLGIGTHSVPVEVTVPEGFSVVGTPAIRLQLDSRTTEAEDAAAVNETNSAGKTPSDDSGEGLQHSEN